MSFTRLQQHSLLGVEQVL